MSVIRSEFLRIANELIPKFIASIENGDIIRIGAKDFMRAYNAACCFDGDKFGVFYFLCEKYLSIIKKYANGFAKVEILSSQGKDLFANLIKRWEKHEKFVFCVRKIFLYIDNIKLSDKKPFVQAGLNVFKTELFDKIPKNEIKNSIIELVHNEPENDINYHFLNEIFIFLSKISSNKGDIIKKENEFLWEGELNIDFCDQIFEEFFMEEIKKFYCSKPSEWLSSLLISENFQKVVEIVEELKELEIFENIRNKILKIIVDEILKRIALNLEENIETSHAILFEIDKKDEIKMIYEIFKSSEYSLQSVKTIFAQYIEKRGLEIVSDTKFQQDPIEVVRAILNYKTETDDLSKYLFNGVAENSINVGFQNFIYKFEVSAKYIASYCHHVMSKEILMLSDTEIEKKLGEITMLFGWLYSKDEFINMHAYYLVKRLLVKASVNIYAEKLLMQKLKSKCLYIDVNKINNIYNDIALSEEMTVEFNQRNNENCSYKIEFSVQACMLGIWPGLSSESFLLPEEIQWFNREFYKFYINKFKGRSLTWATGLGTVEISGSSPSRNYTLIVNPYQATILLLFNDRNSYSVKELMQIVKLSDRTFKENFIKFFNPKMKLFNKESKGKTLNDEELITINDNFRTAALRVSYLPKNFGKNTFSGPKEDEKLIISERKHILDTVILKIAKSKNVINHHDLIAEIMKEVRIFKPQPSMINAQIESLIEREFLARDEADSFTYKYMP